MPRRFAPARPPHRCASGRNGNNVLAVAVASRANRGSPRSRQKAPRRETPQLARKAFSGRARSCRSTSIRESRNRRSLVESREPIISALSLSIDLAPDGRSVYLRSPTTSGPLEVRDLPGLRLDTPGSRTRQRSPAVSRCCRGARFCAERRRACRSGERPDGKEGDKEGGEEEVKARGAATVSRTSPLRSRSIRRGRASRSACERNGGSPRPSRVGP